MLQAAGVSWKIYQDLAGTTFAPDFGDGTGNSFAGNFTDNSMLYFNQYATAAPGTPLFDNACTGTEIINIIPSVAAPGARLAGLGRAPVRRLPKRREGRQTAAGFLDRRRRPVIPNTRIGRSTTAPGTSPRSSTSWCPTPRCSARPSSSSTTTRPTGASTTSCRRTPPQTPAYWGLDGQHRKRDRHDVDPDRPDRPRHACAVPCDLALEQGRLRQFPGLRSHLGDPVHREAFRSPRAQYLPVAPCGGW